MSGERGPRSSGDPAPTPGTLDALRLHLPADLEAEFAREYFREPIRHHRFVLALGAGFFALFGLLDRITIPEAPAALWIVRFGVILPVLLASLASTLWSGFHRIAAGVLDAAMLTAGLGLVAMGALAPAPADRTFFVGLMLTLLAFHTLVRVPFAHRAAVSWTIVAGYAVTVLAIHPLPRAEAINGLFFLVAANVIGLAAGYTIERHARSAFLQRRHLEAERQRSEGLLLNILPAPVVERLKGGAETIADSFEEVTVLFADLAGFTPLADRLPPQEVVRLLNAVFSAFDRVAERHGLEKVKTMGDCYMLVGGLPAPRTDHARAVADAALDVQRVLAELKLAGLPDLQIRIGIHSGPVVAGVIGTRKFSYDLWGDTVNVASRMESHGRPGWIQVSAASAASLSGDYVLEPRGPLPIKGKGEMETFWLLGRRDGGAGTPARPGPDAERGEE